MKCIIQVVQVFLSIAFFFHGAFPTPSAGTPKHPEADISFLFDFAASRGLSKEWNFVAESFLAPEGGRKKGYAGADENVVWKVGKGNGDQLVWEGNRNSSDDFFPGSLLLGHSTKIIGSLVLRGL